MLEQEGSHDPLDKLKEKYTKILEGFQKQIMKAYDDEKVRVELKLDREQYQLPEDLQ